jgi:hypothetical protein
MKAKTSGLLGIALIGLIDIIYHDILPFVSGS